VIQGSVCSQESAEHFFLLTIEIQTEVGLIFVPEARHLPDIILIAAFFYAKKPHVLAAFLVRQVKLHAASKPVARNSSSDIWTSGRCRRVPCYQLSDLHYIAVGQRSRVVRWVCFDPFEHVMHPAIFPGAEPEDV
jgi:hypothetical protein